MNYLITAGPTREFIDAIRFISNVSSGRMGYALAEAAVAAGHRVVLVSGPVHLEPPAGAELVPVVSALEMREAVLNRAGESDIIVMCAAVADYRPAARVAGKMKKGPDSITLELVKNPDILAELGTMKRRNEFSHAVCVVGFALEAADPLRNARSKLESKNADMIVLNLPPALGGETSDVQVISRDGSIMRIGPAPKKAIAAELIRMFDAAMAGNQNPEFRIQNSE